MQTISIIIPVFNAEKYLSECIESILKQTYKEFEVILIDDGSTDQSLNILKKYQKKDYRIRIIHQENKGVGVARNNGIDNAKGEFIIFVDADDVLPENSLYDRLSAVKNADMAICGYGYFSESGKRDTLAECEDTVWNKIQALNNIAVDGTFGYQGYLWNKIYVKNIIDRHKIRFAENIAYNEDKLFNIEYVMSCKDIKISHSIVYYYRTDANGVMNRISKITDKDASKLLSDFDAFNCMIKIVSEIDEQLKYKIAFYAMGRAVYLGKLLPKENVSYIRKKIKNYIRLYGMFSLKMNRCNISFRKKAKIIGHVILGR